MESQAKITAGRQIIDGVIFDAQYQNTDWGLKMNIFIKSQGQIFRGPLPSSIKSSESLIGRRITFTATIEPSYRDPFLGFFKRPTKAILKDPDA